MEIKFDAGKRLYTNAIRHRFVQGENQAESITITGPKQVGALDLSQLRMAVRVNSLTYETTVEKTLSQTVEGENISLEWVVDKMFTAVPGPVSVTLVGYGNEEEVIKITSDGILVKADDVNGTAPPESTWEQMLAEMQQFATETYQNAQAAADSEANAKASEATAQQAAEQATNAAETASDDAAAATEEKIKQFADDRYARALKATAGPAAQLTIYPDEGSSLQITVHGSTVKAGSGDPSPANIRALSGVGRKMYRYVVTGQENWGTSATTKGDYRASLPASQLPATPLTPSSADLIAAVFCTLYPTVSATNTFNGIFGFGVTTNGTVYIYDPAYNTNDISAWKQHLQALYAAGTPLVLYYVPSDESRATGWYTYAAASGDTYTAVGMELDGPLFDGDSINNNADIAAGRQCAVYRVRKLFEFDGSPDETWNMDSVNGSVRFHTPLGNEILVSDTTSGPTSECNYLPLAVRNGTYNIADVYTINAWSTGVSLFVRITGVDTVDALRTYLAQTPLQVLATLAAPTTTYSTAQPLIDNPDTEGKVSITGEGQVSAAYNKSITRAIAELQAAALAMGANLSI